MSAHADDQPMHSPKGDFIVIELLVVITIIVALAGVSFTLARKMKEQAAASNSLSDVRHAGTILLAKTSDTNGRCQYFAGGAGGFDLRPYFILRNELGIDENQGTGVVEIMHWDGGRKVESNPALNAHWTCRAVNFTNVPNFNAVWISVPTVPDSQGRKPVWG